MLLIIAGNGKGKTTSAIGTAVRSIGWGKKVAMVCFDKAGAHYGEQPIFDLLQDKIDSFRFGQKRFDEKVKKFRFETTDSDKKEAEKGVRKMYELYDKKYFLIIADELVSCLSRGLVGERAVRELIEKCPPDTHLILTGRNAPEWIVEKADLVSEVQEIKHYFTSGQQAIKGLDY